MTISTVDTGGSGPGIYTSWQAWEDDCPNDITAGGTNEDWIGEGVNEEFVGSDAQIIFGGITTDATHRLIMRPASGDGWLDNVDPDTDALRYNPSLGCSLRENRNYITLLNFGGSNSVRCEVTGLQLSASSTHARGILCTSHSQPVLISQCVTDFLVSGSGSVSINIFKGSGDDSKIENSAIIHTGTTASVIQGRGVVCNYVSFYGPPSGSQVSASYGSHTFTNCLFLNSNDFQGGTLNHTVDSCVTDLSSWESSTATTSVLNATGSDEIENDSGSNTTVDLRIKAGGDCDGGGENISGITTDIYGNTRDGSTPTVGCMEVLAAGGNTITADQDEAGDSQSASISALVQISANQSESGDTQSAAISPISQITATQTEAGDTQSASISVVAEANISASQAEDGDTQSAALSNAAQVSANQAEVGDAQSASLSNVIQISSNQNEEGDTQSAALTSVLTSNITASQLEEGDSQTAAISNVISITANQAEEGDTQTATLNNVVRISANQLESGDITRARIGDSTPDSYFSVIGRIDPTGQNVRGTINSGYTSVSGIIDDDGISVIGRIDTTSSNVSGAI